MEKVKDKIKSEKEIYNFWIREKLFSANPSSYKKPFSLLVPPPNLTGELHLGHAMQHAILDALARYKRLKGFDVLLLPGVDHAGIQFEATFDRYLKKKGLSKRKLDRDKWLKEAWKFKDEVYESVSKTWRFLGLSADWEREVFTLDDGPRQAVFHEFKTYYERGLIYKGPYIVQWCPKCNTAIEDAEMEYEDRREKFYYIKYPLADNSTKFITIATVRPETMFADVAVAVNPKDKKYKNLIGKKVKVPFIEKEVPIIADSSIDIKLGTGALKVDPAHSLVDYEIGKKNNLEIISVIGKDGKLNENAEKFAGEDAQAVRKIIVDDLEEQGLLEKTEDIKHSVPICERSKNVVEPLISEEWFVKVDELAKDAIKVINQEEIKFLPKNYKRVLVEWLKEIHDWCISRSLWWGHRIPVWYKSGDMKVSIDSPGEGWKQDEQVLDTWFSSGLWPMSTLGWPKRVKELERYFPWDFEITAPEIKFLWIARMIMLSKYFMDNIPFKTMFFHGMLRDLQGRKFSKSLGNGVDPNYLIDQWGVDATRMALYTYSIPGRDGRVSKQLLDERGKNFRNFGTKLRNISRFILELKPETNDDRQMTRDKDDELIINELDKTIKSVTKHIEKIELHLAVDTLYNFVWHEFADKYIEKSKERREEAQPTLEHVLKQVLILLHPFMPFTTEELYWKFEVRKKSILLEEFPQ